MRTSKRACGCSLFGCCLSCHCHCQRGICLVESNQVGRTIAAGMVNGKALSYVKRLSSLEGLLVVVTK